MLRSLRILLSIMHDTNDNGFLCYIIQNFPLRKFHPYTVTILSHCPATMTLSSFFFSCTASSASSKSFPSKIPGSNSRIAFPKELKFFPTTLSLELSKQYFIKYLVFCQYMPIRNTKMLSPDCCTGRHFPNRKCHMTDTMR